MRFNLVKIWALLIFILSVFPQGRAPTSVPYFDKIGHFLVYVVFAVLIVRNYYRSETKSFIKFFLFTLILAGGYGILMELVQLFIPMRNADIRDVFVNIAGAAMGAAIALSRIKLLRRI